MRKTVLVLVGCLVLTAAPAWAGGAFSLFGTYGQINDYNSTFGGGARLTLGGESFVVDLTGTWYPSVNGTAVKTGDGAIFGQIQLIPFDLGLRWIFAPGSELRPYVGAGASYALVDFSGGDSDDEFGYYLLAGFHIFGWGNGGMYVEGMYRWLDGHFYVGGVEYEERVGGFAGTFGVSFTF